jgi:hypothetical protein
MFAVLWTQHLCSRVPGKASHSSHHVAFRRVMVEDDSPSASGPRSAASASLKSPVEMPFK